MMGNIIRDGLIINQYGTKFYYLNDKFHRDGNLPAIERKNGDKEYWIHNKLHREDGPACEYTYGKFYFLNDQEYSEQDYWKEIKRIKSLNYILSNISGYKKATFCFADCLGRPNEIHEVFQNSRGDWGVRGGLEPLRMADKVVTEDGITIKDRYN